MMAERGQRIRRRLVAVLLAGLSMAKALGQETIEAEGNSAMHPTSKSGTNPATFPLSAEQVESRDFLDCFREAAQAWSLTLYDPATGGFGAKPGAPPDLLTTADMIWLRYACNVEDRNLGAPDRAKISAYLDAPLAEQTGHKLWTATRALRILGAEPSRVPARYQGLTDVAAFEAHVRDRYMEKEENHHEVLGLLPLVVSSGNPAFVEVLLKALADAQGPDGQWPRNKFNWSRTFAYASIHLAAGRIPPQPEKILSLMEREMTKGYRITVSPVGSYHDMDALFVLGRLPAALKHARTVEIRDKIRRGLPDFRRAFLAEQGKLATNPHGYMLACAHILGLLQEALPDELPSERPFRFDWDKLELYRCAVIAKVFGK